MVVCVCVKLPVITDLRNPCLKERHWGMLESILGVSLVENPPTCDALQELGAFNYAAEIQEVRDIWKMDK